MGGKKKKAQSTHTQNVEAEKHFEKMDKNQLFLTHMIME